MPLPGSRAPRGTAIQAFVSTGASAVAIPTLSGARPDDAVEQLRQPEARCRPPARGTERHDRGRPGRSAPIRPPGDRSAPDTEVTLIVSTGRAQKPIPKVLGFRLSKAKKTLEDAGFKVGTTRTGSSDNFDDR